MNYKNELTGQVIGEDCYRKLPVIKQIDYVEVDEEPTHQYESVDREDDDSDGFLLTAIATEEIVSALSDVSSLTSNDDNTTFGGGDFGGGGASGDW